MAWSEAARRAAALARKRKSQMRVDVGDGRTVSRVEMASYIRRQRYRQRGSPFINASGSTSHMPSKRTVIRARNLDVRRYARRDAHAEANVRRVGAPKRKRSTIIRRRRA